MGRESIPDLSNADLWLHRAVRECRMSSCAENHLRDVWTALNHKRRQRMNWPHARIAVVVVWLVAMALGFMPI